MIERFTSKISRFARRAEESNGVDEWFRAMYREHAQSLLYFLMRLTNGNRQMAEDITQETLLRAWRKAPTLNVNADSMRPWLFTVARRIVVDEYRRRSARPQEVDGEVLQFIPVEDEIDSMLQSVVVVEALASLSESHRAALREVYFRERSIDEAAEILRIPAGTVKSRCYYALRALRLALEERGITGV